MRSVVYLICIAVASFVVLAQPVVVQEANTTLPLFYPGQILQGDAIQTCPSEKQEERVRNEIDNATLSLLRETVLPLLQACGSTSTCLIPPSSVPLCGRRSPLHTGCVGEDPPLVAVRGSLTPLVMCSMTRCAEGSLATS